MRRTFVALVTLIALAAAPAAHASENLTHVKNLAYAPANGGTPNYGTDIEFATLNGREYALAGSYKNGMQIVDITNPSDAEIAARLRLRRDPGRRPGLPPGRQARAARSPPTRRTPSATAPPRATARPRRSASTSQAGRHGPQRHVHRRDHRPARAEDRLVRRGHAGLAQPDRAPERQLPLQLELRPDHVDPAGDRGLRHLRLRGAAARPASSRSRRAPASAPSRTTSPSTPTARARTRRRCRQGVIIDTDRPGRTRRSSRAPRPGDQRLAPDRAVTSRDRRPHVPDRRGRVRGRGSAPASARTAACTSTTSPAPETEPGEGRLLEHRRPSARPPTPRRAAAPRTCSTSTRTSS